MKINIGKDNWMEKGGDRMKAYKIRCYPNEEQKELILKTFGCCRWYWNQALSDNINYYKDNKKSKIKSREIF